MRLIIAFCVLAAACGEDANIGARCVGDGDCAGSETCSTAVAGGYCTLPCSAAGDVAGCPDGAICDSSPLGTTCVQICQSAADCRADLDCNGTSGSNIKACKPKV